MENLNTYVEKSLPDRLDFVYSLAISSFLIFVGSLDNIFEHLQIPGLLAILESQAGQMFTGLLETIDSFSISKSLFSFLLWAFIGFFSYQMVRIVIGIKSANSARGELGSKDYLRPKSMNHISFYKTAVFTRTVNAILYAYMVFVALMFVIVGLPEAIQSLSNTLLLANLQSIATCGFWCLFSVWSCVLNGYAIKLLRNRAVLFDW